MRKKLMTLLLGSLALFSFLAINPAQAQKADEKPIAHGRLSGVGVAKPIYKSDINKEVEQVRVEIDKLLAQIEGIKLNPEKDSVEKMFGGSISLARHMADIGDVRDQFTRCVGVMRNEDYAKRASGTATATDEAQFSKCIEHCDKVLAKLSGMHLSASRLTTATRRQYILAGWEHHKKGMAELKTMVDECAPMMSATLECCKVDPNADEPAVKR